MPKFEGPYRVLEIRNNNLIIWKRGKRVTVNINPCSCQSDCLVCGRGEEPPHDCAIHVLLKSMVFQERMLHGEPTEAKLEEILKNGKEYLPLVMHMTNENSVRWQTMYNYVKSGLPQHQGNSSRNVR
ncbi:uncharacterized protein TNCV_768421 [Trichonephila clavipes]|nr:uncharacterized protein TNCV_768421 [Trichonephila clavipes]